MDLSWTKHIKDPEKRKDFEKTIKNSTLITNRLLELISEYEQALLTEETNSDDFSDSNWAYKQAYRNGRKTELQRLKKLLTIKRN